MYPSKVIGPNILLMYLKPTLKNATILSKIVCENACYLSPFFEQMVQSYETPEKTLAAIEYDEMCRLQCQMLPYYIVKDNEILGEITAEWRDKDDSTEVLYWINQKYNGLGYVSEAVKLMEKALFNGGHNQICLYIKETNFRSQEVAKKNGYKLSDSGNYYYKTRKEYFKQTAEKSQCVCQQNRGIAHFFRTFWPHTR